MTEHEIRTLFESHDALITGSHIVYTSGRHGSAYMNKDALYPHTTDISTLCDELARRFKDLTPDVVIGPALGGIILSQWTAHHLTRMLGREVYGVYAEKSDDEAGFRISRGYDELIKGKRALIVEDVLTTGGSVKKVVAVARALGSEIVGVAALCNRGGITADKIGAPILSSLVDFELESWESSACPLCAENIPINIRVGKGKDFLATQH